MNTPLVILAVIWAVSTLVQVTQVIVSSAKGHKTAGTVIGLLVTVIVQALLYSAGLWSLW